MTDKTGVFVVRDGSLISMPPAQFTSENDFQILLSKYPSLLVGDQIDPESPRRWILVKREQSIATGEEGASVWSIDHLFLDQDGIPTLVEIKRQSDSRIRREVVGQMLDYAANCSTYWSVESLQSGFEQTCAQSGKSPEAEITALIGEEQSVEEFWKQVKTNLQAQRIRMLFVADVIPIELRRIVEFLNFQMDPAEVLAVELRQFAGEGIQTLVPMVYGQTQVALAKRNGVITGQRWDEGKILDKLRSQLSSDELGVALHILEWMKQTGRPLVFGTGRENGSVYPLYRPSGISINPAYLSTDGKLWLQFGSLRGKPVFGSAEKCQELMNKFSSIEGVKFTNDDLSKYPSIPFSKIVADPEGQTKLIAALDWMHRQIENPTKGSELA